MDEDLALLPAVELLRRYAARNLSPLAATEAALRRIEGHNERLNAFLLVDAEGALKAARAAELRWAEGRPAGRLDGVPVSIKDLAAAVGWPTRRGSLITKAEPLADSDAPSVARLREAGAILLGKTTTPEFGWKGVTDSPLSGVTRNPWDPLRTPGGSSGGAAVAVATGMGALAQGGDGGGSIRIPAAVTGVFGLKPSFGRVPSYPPSPFGTLMQHGPLTRCVADAALMLSVMAQGDPRDYLALPPDGADYLEGLEAGVRGLRIAFSLDTRGAKLEPSVSRLVRRAAQRFEDLGARVEQADPPLAGAEDIFRTIWSAGAHTLLARLSADRRAELDPGLAELAEQGARISLLDYKSAEQARAGLAKAMQEFHSRYHLLLTPSVPITAFAAGRDAPEGFEDWIAWTPFSYPFNLTGQPAASVPCGLSEDGLPVGLQIVGPRFAERNIMRAARAFERAEPWSLPRLS